MIAMLRSQSNAGTVVEPQPPSRLLPFGYFGPSTAPDPLDAITANLPAGFGKKRPDPTIAIASITRSQRDNRARQRIFISPDDGGVSLRPAWLADDPAGMTFRETVLLPNALLDCLAAPLGAYKFPKATSLSTCFSSERSATRRFRRRRSRVAAPSSAWPDQVQARRTPSPSITTLLRNSGFSARYRRCLALRHQHLDRRSSKTICSALNLFFGVP